MATANSSIIIEMSIDDKGVYTVINRVAGTLRDFQKTANQTALSVKRLEEANSSVSTKFRHLITTLGALRFAAMDVNDVFLRLPLAILKTAGDLEKTRALLGGLSSQVTKTGRDAEAAFNFKYITDMAQKAPFEIAALSDSFVKLKSAGLDPAGGSLQALTDSVAKFGGTGETMKRASVAIQQMLGKGVVSMEELRQQLGEAVPTAMRDMATGMGISMAELTKAVSKGTVEAGDAINKMLVVMGLRNRGAAEEMMKTWNGVQAQLKTRLQLAAEEVSKAGFGDAMKKVAGEVSQALNSIDARRLTEAFGRNLGEGVTSLVAVSKALIEHADLIKTAAIAWAVYKVASSVIQPTLNGAWGQIQKVNKAYKEQTAVVLAGVNLERESASQRAQIAGAAAQVQMTSSATSIAAMEKEMAFRSAMTARMRVEMAALNNAMLGSGRVPRGQPGAGQFMDKDVVRQQILSISRLEAAHMAANGKIQSELTKTRAAHAAAGLDVMRHAGAVDSLATNVTKVSGAMQMMSRAAGLANTAFNALGGWITVLNLAISAGIYLWMNWGAAAEEAGRRADRVRSGTSTQEDTDELIKSENKALANKLRVQRALESAQNSPLGSPNSVAQKAQVASLLTANEKADAELTRITQLRVASRVNVQREGARVEADNIVRSVDVVTTGIRNASVTKLAAIELAYENEMKAAGTDATKKAQAEKNKGVQTTGLALQEGQTKADAIRKAVTYLATQFNGPQGDAAKTAAGILREKLTSATNEVNMALSAQGENKIIGGKGAGGTAAVSKVQKFIGDLKEQQAELEVALKGVLGTLGKANPVEMALAKAQEKLANGDLDGTGKKGVKATAAEKKAVLDRVRTVEEMKLLLDDTKTVTEYANSVKGDYESALAFLTNPFSEGAAANTEKFAKMLQKLNASPEQLGALVVKYKSMGKDLIREIEEGGRQAATLDIEATYKPIVDKIKSMAPDYAEALQVLANPLGDTEGRRSNQFDEFLAKVGTTQERLKQLADASGITLERLIGMVALAQEGSRAAATIDLAASYRTLVDENRKLGLEMVQDDRQRTRMQMQSENDLADAKAQNRIREAIARRVDQAEVERMSAAASENAILRAEDLRLKTRTPMERLADDWSQSMTKMDEATATWSTSFVDMITNAASTGKLEFGGFVKSVLADVLKISLQKSLGRPLQDIMGQATDWIKQQTGTGENGVNPGTIAAAEALAAVRAKADLVARSFADMTGMGIAPATRGMIDSIAADGQSLLATGAFTSSMSTATAAIYNFVAALQSGGAMAGVAGSSGLLNGLGGLFGSSGTDFASGGILEEFAPNFLLPFADGGIMSSMGSVPLRKYAAGGIANSPQMAMFGEGDQNEAYVPLPDGRRIPVAMQGGAPAVTVNVINQSGTPMAAQQSQPRFDGKQMILDVVLTAANQPGGFRDGMKGAMR